MKNKKSKKKWIVAATAFAAMAALAATFAWFQSEDKAKNHFEGNIAGNDIEVVETFTPPTDWKPGTDVNKDVTILNTGDYKALVRVSFEELLSLLQNPESQLSDSATALNGKTESDIYVYPFDEAVLSSADWAGATDSKVADTKLTVATGDFSGTWTLKAKEVKVTTAAGTTYKYVSYWENGSKKIYAKVGQYIRATDGTITPQKAEFKYVDLAVIAPEQKNWYGTPGYAPTPSITIDNDGKATIASKSDANITLQFVNLVSNADAKTPAGQNKWTYNQADGYFYYIGVVDAQQQTAQILDSVKLLTSADNSYSKVQFDLTVIAKSIQAQVEATNSSSWLNNTNADIKAALEGLSF